MISRASILFFVFFCALAQAAELPRAQFNEKHRAFFKDYCVECHNAEKQKGKLRLDDIAFGIGTLENAERWQKILNALNSGEMPPEDETQPDKARKTKFLDDLSCTLVIARKVLGDAGGQIEGHDWDLVKEEFADRLELILSRHIKDFDKIKLARRAYSPADLERMNINLVGGDPYGGACSIDQFFIWRPFAHSTNGVGPVRGLIHIGASTHPGPGLGGGSGFNAAKRLGA